MAISWMQRHKKWLIVTIWISTIAFVGAGFVGWGSYNYGKSDGAVAIVGDKEIPLGDLQNEYSNLYSQYQGMFGGKLNQEMAKQLGLEQAAMQRVINKYLFLNYAEDLGLITTDEEVAEELVQMTAFQKDGKFDKNTYLQVLKQNRRTAAEFEKQLKQDLLVNKVQKIFSLELENNEIDNIGNLLFLESDVAVKVIDGESIKINPSMDELQKFYDENKENYKSPLGHSISIIKVENIEGNDKKAMKKVALKKYLALKKGEEKFETTQTVYDLSTVLDSETMDEFSKTEDNKVLKPFYKDDNYYIVKKEKTIQPQVLPFEKVRSQINKAFISSQKEKQLEEIAKKTIESDFTGIDLGYINRNTNLNVKGLLENETIELKEAIFSSSKQKNYLNLKDKLVIFKIKDTKLGTMNAQRSQMVVSTIQNYKANAISSELLEQLQNRYEIKSYLTE